MLKGINPLLSPDLLYVLRAMGHGDELVVADANFPVAAVSKTTTFGEALVLSGASVVEAISAVLSVFPLDTFVDTPAWRMELVDEPASVPPVQQEVQALIDAALERDCPMAGLERHGFYDRARAAFAVVGTEELRPYGDFILKKGVINAFDAGHYLVESH